MTVSYQGKLANNESWVLFKLMLRWKGSIYKAVWPDLLLFLILYMSFKLLYELVLNEDEKRIFEIISRYCEKNSNLIPLSFVLGFYVSLVMRRWWGQYKTIPSPNTIAIKVSAAMTGKDEECRIMRRTILRYMNLSHVLTFQKVSVMVRKRFRDLDDLVETGLLNFEEKKTIEQVSNITNCIPTWLPTVWAMTVTKEAFEKGKIRSEIALNEIIHDIDVFRGALGKILSYDYISVPLMYTQVVVWSVYMYFLACVMGRQMILNPRETGESFEIPIPFFTILQFIFYIGWLKTAQTLMNPFGEDEDDFEMNTMIDTNITNSFLIVDNLYDKRPKLHKDAFWEETPNGLGYRPSVRKYRRSGPPPGSAEEESISVLLKTFHASVESGEGTGSRISRQYHRLSSYLGSYLHPCTSISQNITNDSEELFNNPDTHSRGQSDATVIDKGNYANKSTVALDCSKMSNISNADRINFEEE